MIKSFNYLIVPIQAIVLKLAWPFAGKLIFRMNKFSYPLI